MEKFDGQYYQLSTRHSQLIDKKWLFGLTEEEQKELSQIDEQMEKVEADFYEPILKKLKNEVEKIRSAQQKRG